MCGIFGYLGSPPAEKHNFAFRLLQALAVSSSVRGKDATGFAALRVTSPELIIDKRPIISGKFVMQSKPFQFLRFGMPEAVIGHCRATTSGDPKLGRNNHPFTSNSYTLVHNGRVEKWEDIAKKRNIKLRTDTDSEILIHIMEASKSPIDGIREIADIENIAIATAVLKHDDHANPRLYLFRNKERPLQLMYCAELNSVFFASSPEVINGAFELMKLQPNEAMKAFGMVIKELPTNMMGEWILDENKNPKPGINEIITPTPPAPSPPKITGKVIQAKAAIDPPASPKEEPAAPPAETKPATTTAVEIKKQIDEVTELKTVLESIRDNLYMEDVELKHWNDWRKSSARQR